MSHFQNGSKSRSRVFLLRWLTFFELSRFLMHMTSRETCFIRWLFEPSHHTPRTSFKILPISVIPFLAANVFTLSLLSLCHALYSGIVASKCFCHRIDDSIPRVLFRILCRSSIGSKDIIVYREPPTKNYNCYDDCPIETRNTASPSPLLTLESEPHK